MCFLFVNQHSCYMRAVDSAKAPIGGIQSYCMDFDNDAIRLEHWERFRAEFDLAAFDAALRCHNGAAPRR